MPEADFVQDVQGWNERMEAEITRNFGADILQRLHEEARQRWQGKVAPEGKP